MQRCLVIILIYAGGTALASDSSESTSSERCELPVNFQNLPTFAQDEIRAVWKNYVPGQNCKKEVLITEDILSVLEMFDKELIIDKDFLSSGSKFNHFTTNPLNQRLHQKALEGSEVGFSTTTAGSFNSEATNGQNLNSQPIRTQNPNTDGVLNSDNRRIQSTSFEKSITSRLPSADVEFPTLVPNIEPDFSEKTLTNDNSNSNLELQNQDSTRFGSLESTISPVFNKDFSTTTNFSLLSTTTPLANWEVDHTETTTTVSTVNQWIQTFQQPNINQDSENLQNQQNFNLQATEQQQKLAQIAPIVPEDNARPSKTVQNPDSRLRQQFKNPNEVLKHLKDTSNSSGDDKSTPKERLEHDQTGLNLRTLLQSSENDRQLESSEDHQSKSTDLEASKPKIDLRMSEEESPNSEESKTRSSEDDQSPEAPVIHDRTSVAHFKGEDDVLTSETTIADFSNLNIEKSSSYDSRKDFSSFDKSKSFVRPESKNKNNQQREYLEKVRRPLKTKVDFHEYQDYEEILKLEAQKAQRDEERKQKEIGNDKFYEPIDSALPFLQGASPVVQRVFKEVLNDPDVLSEGKRQDEIHVLAVSYLNPEQLEIFNDWSLARRKRIQQREERLYPLSRPARTALKDLSLTAQSKRMRKVRLLDSEVREELRDYAIRLREENH
ncbi:unnamed protein product [Bursaphelenchus okinawaensis]|uniref:Uncharacterized protein n=1 Tax=Bursaphelenchus okinawaensis TaxID=465554 RepID=A0A811KNG8_9BILA|nr:unnamed protein product [Bursaphelenchus okinawaensis]CAG9108362.1 unnamed protein product [Bursaphelenchus okinawaensis]